MAIDVNGLTISRRGEVPMIFVVFEHAQQTSCVSTWSKPLCAPLQVMSFGQGYLCEAVPSTPLSVQ